MIDDHWQRWYLLGYASAAVFTIGFSIHALWFLHFLDYYNEQQLWDYLISGIALHSMIWYFDPAFVYWYYYIDDHY